MLKINNVNVKAISNLKNLKIFISSLNSPNNTARIKMSISDINKCIEHGNYYIENPTLYKPENFRFHNGLVSLVDTIKYNDFGIKLSKNEKNEKLKFCNELIKLVERIIILNNKLKQFDDKKNT